MEELCVTVSFGPDVLAKLTSTPAAALPLVPVICAVMLCTWPTVFVANSGAREHAARAWPEEKMNVNKTAKTLTVLASRTDLVFVIPPYRISGSLVGNV